jgi:colicin import membrane protein
VKRVPSNNPTSMRRPVVISAIVHAVTLVALIVIPGTGFMMSDRPIKINVTWVELPRGTSEEVDFGMKKAKGLPKSTIEEQRKLFEPKGTQTPLKPKMKAPVTAKKETQKKPAPRPKIKTPKKAKVRRASKTDRTIKSALAKIDRQLKKRQIVPESAQIKESSDGFKYGTGNKPVRVNPSDAVYLKYQAKVRAKIIREWIIPVKFTEEGAGRHNAQIEVTINSDGDVLSIRWSSPSGNQTFDQSAVRAIKKASPLPKPPDKLAWEAYNEGFLVEFDPRLKPRY